MTVEPEIKYLTKYFNKINKFSAVVKQPEEPTGELGTNISGRWQQRSIKGRWRREIGSYNSANVPKIGHLQCYISDIKKLWFGKKSLKLDTQKKNITSIVYA